jgi:hypothetical protein
MVVVFILSSYCHNVIFMRFVLHPIIIQIIRQEMLLNMDGQDLPPALSEFVLNIVGFKF